MRRLQLISIVIVFSLEPTVGADPHEASVQPDCAVTKTDKVYKNDAFGTILPADSTFIFQPGGPGFVDDDGALGTKFAFDLYPGTKGRLNVGGRRLDAPAPPVRAYIPDSYAVSWPRPYYDSGLRTLYLVFPTPGCWEITGGVGELVKKVGDGPNWRMHGPASGRRVTTSAAGDG